MRLIAATLMFLSFNAFSFETVRFSYTDFGNDGFSRNYYSCDFAEAALESHLELLGASNISVSCFGGIQSWGVTPVSLSASFDVPTATAENHTRMTQVRLESADRFETACFFHTKLLTQLLKLFPNAVTRAKRTSCFDNRTRWNYDLNVYL